MSSGMNKSNSARQIFIAMQLDAKPTVIKQRGIKTIEYRGYQIKVSPQLVPGSGIITNWCVIGINDVGIAFRSSIEQAKAFVDAEKERTRDVSKRMVRTRRIVKVPLDCAKCQGSGVDKKGNECTLCRGRGIRL